MIFFHYIARNSFIHNLDARFKIITLPIISFTIMFLNKSENQLTGLICLYLLVFCLFCFARLPLKYIFKDMKYFFIIIPIILFMSAFSLKSNPDYLFNYISQEGAFYGFFFSLKLFLFSLIGILFIGTTTTRQITYGLEYFFRFIPFISSVHLATMISLIITQLPIIFDSYEQVKNAQLSRCSQNRPFFLKNTIYLVKTVCLKIIKNAEYLIMSFESKAYNEERTKFDFITKTTDWFYVISVLLYCVSVCVFVILG